MSQGGHITFLTLQSQSDGGTVWMPGLLMTGGDFVPMTLKCLMFFGGGTEANREGAKRIRLAISNVSSMLCLSGSRLDFIYFLNVPYCFRLVEGCRT